MTGALSNFIATHGAVSVAIVVFGFFLGGFVKGAVGFALPLVAVAFGTSVLPAATAVGLLIVPAVVTNLVQTLRDGLGPLLETARRFWPMNLVVMAVIGVSAQFLPALDERFFFGFLGVGVAFFAGAQLVGWRPRIPNWAERPAGVVAGAVAGVFGGLAGIWGPPTVLYLVALRLMKTEQLRATGLIFLSGSIALVPAHLASGVFNAETIPLSVMALAPTVAGMWFGFAMQDRLDQELFRRATLLVLCVTALNMLRRAFF